MVPYKFVFLSEVERDLQRLDHQIATRIIKKLLWISRQTKPLTHGRILTNPKIGDIRFRIGDYRAVALVDHKKKTVVIAAVGHRRDIYQA